jgi:hypothetical protein
MATVPSRLEALAAAQGPLLGVVDSLRPFGIEGEIDVPQLVVVGE